MTLLHGDIYFNMSVRPFQLPYHDCFAMSRYPTSTPTILAWALHLILDSPVQSGITVSGIMISSGQSGYHWPLVGVQNTCDPQKVCSRPNRTYPQSYILHRIIRNNLFCSLIKWLVNSLYISSLYLPQLIITSPIPLISTSKTHIWYKI